MNWKGKKKGGGKALFLYLFIYLLLLLLLLLVLIFSGADVDRYLSCRVLRLLIYAALRASSTGHNGNTRKPRWDAQVAAFSCRPVPFHQRSNTGHIPGQKWMEMSPTSLFLLSVLGHFWVISGSFLGHFWIIFESFFGSSWDHFKVIFLLRFGVEFRSFLGHFWVILWFIFVSFWSQFQVIFGSVIRSFFSHFLVILKSFFYFDLVSNLGHF